MTMKSDGLASGTADWGNINIGVRTTAMQGFGQDGRGMMLLVLLARTARIGLKMSQSQFIGTL